MQYLIGHMAVRQAVAVNLVTHGGQKTNWASTTTATNHDNDGHRVDKDGHSNDGHNNDSHSKDVRHERKLGR